MAVINPILLTASGNSAAVRLPMRSQNLQPISLLLNMSGGNAQGTVSVQVSNDPNANPDGPAATQALARWNLHDTLQNLTADKNSSIVYPVAYVRLTGTLTSGSAQLQIGLPDPLP